MERTKLLIEYFETHACVDCGERDPIVLEFDHLRDKSLPLPPNEPSEGAVRAMLLGA